LILALVALSQQNCADAMSNTTKCRSGYCVLGSQPASNRCSQPKARH